MARFRKKPVEVEAEQWFPGKQVRGVCLCLKEDDEHVHTTHNNQLVVLEPGDWILPEPNGVNFYPVKPDIFEKTYEPVQ